MCFDLVEYAEYSCKHRVEIKRQTVRRFRDIYDGVFAHYRGLLLIDGLQQEELSFEPASSPTKSQLCSLRSSVSTSHAVQLNLWVLTIRRSRMRPDEPLVVEERGGRCSFCS